MPANPMPKSPHKKTNGWAKGYAPEFSKRVHSHNGQGGVSGKKKKKDRVKVQMPGWPQGVHVKDPGGKASIDACFCGRCFHVNGGPENLKYG